MLHNINHRYVKLITLVSTINQFLHVFQLKKHVFVGITWYEVDLFKIPADLNFKNENSYFDITNCDESSLSSGEEDKHGLT